MVYRLSYLIRLAYSITFGTLISALLDLGSYWAWARIWQTIVFGILAPALAVAINCFDVKVNIIRSEWPYLTAVRSMVMLRASWVF